MKSTEKPVKDEAPDLTEYALLLVIVALAAIASVHGLAGSISNAYKPSEPAPSREFLAIRSFLKSLPLGGIAFNTPTAMEADRSYDIYLDLSAVRPAVELQKELQDKLKGQGIEAATIQIAPRMEARMTGETFRILTVTPETQAIDVQGPTEWQWEITPTRGGTRELHLTLSAILILEGQATPHAMRTFDRKIEVHVTAKRRITDFLHDHWEWTVGSIAAIAIAILRLWKKGHPKKSPPWQAPA